MKKIWALVMTFIIALFSFVACDCTNLGNSGLSGGSSGSSSNSGLVDGQTKQYITHFDGYNQCIVFPAVAWDTTLHKGGKVVNDWNTDMRYVSEGTGSIKVSMHEPAQDKTYWYKGRIEANNGFVSSITDINDATGIFLDICNPSDKTIEVTIEIESASTAMVSVAKDCLPGQWTTVSTTIEEANYDIVNWYSITLKNKTDNETFTVYMDNFYLTFAD